MDLSRVDKNFVLETDLGRDDIEWYNVRQAPFQIYGLYEPQNEGDFIRMPVDIAENVSESVSILNYCTAGGRVRFATDSPFVAVKTKQEFSHSPHMTHAMESGFDLFKLVDERSEFVGAFFPTVDAKGGFEQLRDIANEEKLVTYTLNFPPYGGAKEVYIGIKIGSKLEKGEKYKDIKPIVYYGSSITQGGCASRPGNTYQSIISQKYNLDYLNLGFSGSCKAEISMVEYLRELDMSIFVCDYDYNAPSVEYLSETHSRMYNLFREKQPDTPYVIISKPDAWDRDRKLIDIRGSYERRSIIMKTYLNALEAGDKNVYFIDGADLFGDDNRDNCTIDGVHPNDLGFYRMAENIGAVIKRIVDKL